MPDHRKHRGAHPEDAELFAPAMEPILCTAVAELSWLLSRGYSVRSSLALVGDRHRLNARQRKAVERCSCSDDQLATRTAHRVELEALRGAELWIDGFNLLTTIEAAFGGCPLLVGRDQCVRDMASMHGSYRRVEETRPAIDAVGELLELVEPRSVRWLLDRPVSNSGRLAAMLLERAAERGWCWEAELVADPDRNLGAAQGPIVASADSQILDQCGSWVALSGLVVDAAVPGAWRLKLGT